MSAERTVLRYLLAAFGLLVCLGPFYSTGMLILVERFGQLLPERVVLAIMIAAPLVVTALGAGALIRRGASLERLAAFDISLYLLLVVVSLLTVPIASVLRTLVRDDYLVFELQNVIIVVATYSLAYALVYEGWYFRIKRAVASRFRDG